MHVSCVRHALTLQPQLNKSAQGLENGYAQRIDHLLGRALVQLNLCLAQTPMSRYLCRLMGSLPTVASISGR